MSKLKILIADDHHLIRDGIRAMLSRVKDFEIVEDAKNGKEAIEKTAKFKPDIVIMDISMPEISGIDASKIIKKKHPNVKILALTQHENDEYIYQILKAGGSGYILKNTKKSDFIDAIRTVAKGDNYFGKNISDLIIQQYLHQGELKKKPRRVEESEIPLTKRETEIIKLIAEEFNNQQIADKLFISLRTVETHRRNIMQKLKIKSGIALIKYAIQKGIISVN